MQEEVVQVLVGGVDGGDEAERHLEQRLLAVHPADIGTRVLATDTQTDIHTIRERNNCLPTQTYTLEMQHFITTLPATGTPVISCYRR